MVANNVGQSIQNFFCVTYYLYNDKTIKYAYRRLTWVSLYILCCDINPRIVDLNLFYIHIIDAKNY